MPAGLMGTQVGAAHVKLSVDPSGFNTGLAAASGGLAKFAKMALPIAALVGLALAFKKVVSEAAAFEQSMAMVRSVTMATGSEFDALTDKAKELGKATKWTMVEIASGMEELGRAGFKPREIIEAIGGVSDLASSQLIGLGQAANMVAAAMRGMGEAASESTRIADIFAYAASNSAARVEGLADALSYAAPLARAAGWSTEMTVAAISKLSDAAIRGSRAGTTLRFALAELLELSDDFRDKLKDAGVAMEDLTDTEGNLKSLTEILKVLEQAGVKAGKMMELFGKRAGPGMLILLQTGTRALEDFTNQLESAGGTAQEMAEIQLDTFTGQLTIMKSSLSAFAESIGQLLLPALTSVVRSLTTIINMFNDFIGLLKEAGEAINAFFGLAGAPGVPKGMTLTEEGWLLPHGIVTTKTTAEWVEAARKMGEELAAEFLRAEPAFIKQAESMGIAIAKTWGTRIAEYFRSGEFKGTEEEIAAARRAFLEALGRELPADFMRVLLENIPGYAFEELTGVILAASAEFKELTEAQAAFRGGTFNLMDSIDRYVALMRDGVRPIREFIDGMLATGAAYAGQPEVLAKLVEGMEAELEERKKALEIAKVFNTATEEQITAIELLETVLGKVSVELEKISKVSMSASQQVSGMAGLLQKINPQFDAFLASFMEYGRSVRWSTDLTISVNAYLESQLRIYEAMSKMAWLSVEAQEEAARKASLLAAALGKAESSVNKFAEMLPSIVSAVAGAVSKYGGPLGPEMAGLVSGLQPVMTAFVAGTAVSGSVVVGAISAGITFLVSAIALWVQEAIIKPGEEAKQVAKEAAEKLEMAFATLISWVDALTTSFIGLVQQTEAYQRLQVALQSIQEKLLGALFGFLWPIVGLFEELTSLWKAEVEIIKKEIKLRSALTNLNWPLGWKVERFRYAAAIPGQPPVIWDEETADIEETMTWLEELMDSFGATMVAVMEPFRKFLDRLELAWRLISPDIISGLIPVFETFGFALGKLGDWVEFTFIPDMQGFFKGFGDWWKTSVDPFLREKFLPEIGGWLDEIYSWLESIIKFFAGPVWDWLTGPAWEAVKPHVDKILAMFKEFGQWVAANWSDISNFLTTKLDQWLTDFEDNLGGILGVIKNWLSGTSGIGQGASDVAWALGFLATALHIFRIAVEGIAAVFKFIGNVIIGALNAIISLVNLIPFVNIPLIPYLQGGAKVLKEGLAYVHAGEVLPPAMTAPLNYGGAGNRPIVLQVYLDGEQIRSSVRRRDALGNLLTSGNALPQVF